MSSPADSRGSDTLALLVRIQDAVRRVAPKTHMEVRSDDSVVLSPYMRALRLFDGIIVLLERNLPEEALILCRPLFTEALRLAELQAAGDKRPALALGFINESIQERIKLVKEAPKAGLEIEPEKALEALAEERRQLEAYRRRRGVGPLRRFLSERAAAEKFGRTQDHWAFLYSHQFVHGMDASHSHNRSSTEPGVVGIHAQTDSPGVMLGVGGFAGESVIQAVQAAAAIFGWAKPEELERLLSELIALGKTPPPNRS